uniref:Uncharacterized protein n=1 Tax=Alexandrium monilatum TaxID=311494 RepID=A0A7S4SWA4_9DINO
MAEAQLPAEAGEDGPPNQAAVAASRACPAALREEGNVRLRRGDRAAAAALYERALELLERETATAETRHEVALLWGNLSASRLDLGEARAALDAALEASRADCEYAKAYFRQAKALVRLGRPREAANAARWMFFLTGGRGEAAQALLAEASAAREAASPSAPRRLRAPQAPAAALEEEEVLVEVSRCCDGYALAHLARCNLNLHAQVATEEAFAERAVALCPQGSERWLRRDLLDGSGGGHGWLYAGRWDASVASSQGRLAICGTDGRVRILSPATGGAHTLPVPPRCLPYSLCWSRMGDYVAFTAVRDESRAALVLASCRVGGPAPVATPLPPGLSPYFLAPSPCGTRVALLGALNRRQALIIADVAQVTHPSRERAPPVTLLPLGSAAPLYLDWAPHGPELVVFFDGRRLARVRADVLPERDASAAAAETPSQPSDHSCAESFVPLAATLDGMSGVRAPQWLPFPGCPEGRWLVPYPHNGRTALALIPPPAAGEPGEGLRREHLVCETLPPISPQFTASRSGTWVAWTGAFDMHGHQGVFVRRVPPDQHAPIRIFGSAAFAMAWGGDRLALLLADPDPGQPEHFVWACWDPPEEGEGMGLMAVAEEAFKPHRSFLRRVLPFFDQFERTLSLWSPAHDAVAYADSADGVWLQPFPGPGAAVGAPGRHVLSGLLGAEGASVRAPRARPVGRGEMACWSP